MFCSAEGHHHPWLIQEGKCSHISDRKQSVTFKMEMLGWYYVFAVLPRQKWKCGAETHLEVRMKCQSVSSCMGWTTNYVAIGPSSCYFVAQLFFRGKKLHEFNVLWNLWVLRKWALLNNRHRYVLNQRKLFNVRLVQYTFHDNDTKTASPNWEAIVKIIALHYSSLSDPSPPVSGASISFPLWY